MKTLQTAVITDHNRRQFCREKSLQRAKQKQMAWRWRHSPLKKLIFWGGGGGANWQGYVVHKNWNVYRLESVLLHRTQLSAVFSWQEGVSSNIKFQKFPCHKLLKCIWHEKYFLLIWKAFWNTEEWRFSFRNIFFRFRDIVIFVLCKLDKWWRHKICN